MFDLFKDIERYKGTPPYASELYGVYQPLLGWQSALTKQWLRRGGIPVDPRVRRILDGRIRPGPERVDDPHPREFIARPLQPGSGRWPYTVLLAKNLGSEVMRLLQAKVQSHVEQNNGALPSGAQWLSLIDINNFMDEQAGDLRRANDFHRERLYADLVAKLGGQPPTPATIESLRKQHLELMKFESQIAAFLLFYAGAQEGRSPDELQKLFVVRNEPDLMEILRPTDPLASIDPREDGGALSPVGFVDLYRQYFFDLGTFLGEAVEHIWLAPGTTIELVEVSTRRRLAEQMTETTLETTNRFEAASSTKEELSDAVKEENQNSTKLGVTNTNTVNAYVYQGTVSASFGIDTTRNASREQTRRQTREQGERVASEIKRTFKSVFRTVTETTDTRSRRHVISNPGNQLVNYELRRKMRRVGVQLQDIGKRLCWQVFIDNPGEALGLAELVHMTDLGDIVNLKEPEKIPAPTAIVKKVVVPLGYKPVLDYSNNRAQYEFQGPAPNGVLLGIIKGDEDDDDSQIVIEFRGFRYDPPQTGYQLTSDIRVAGVQGGKIAIVRQIVPNTTAGTFDIILERVNFGGENLVNLDVEIVFEPTQPEKDRIEAANKEIQTKFDEEKRQLYRKAYLENVRQRIKDSHAIRARPSWDLRDEERTVVYRKLIERLMLDTWSQPESNQRRRLAHVRSELVRSIFDVDSMLYFVAPEWWMPRRLDHRLNLNVDLHQPPGDARVTLTDADVLQFGGASARRDDNYKITEDSNPAKLGSSLGWLLQLDGDNLRNAFLNAPWVKAVIPIRPGREKAALNWLHVAIEGHESDGWDTPYLGTEPEFAGLTIGEVLEIVADRLQQHNEDIQNVLAADKVFEHGFDHLAEGFDAAVDPDKPFTQWISILPTDQIVAVEYEPTDLLIS